MRAHTGECYQRAAMLKMNVVCLVALGLLGCSSDDARDGASDGGRNGLGGAAGQVGTSGGVPGSSGASAATAGSPTQPSGGAPAGGSGALAGGSGAMVAGEPRGAVSFHVAFGDNCSLSDTWVDFPKVDSGHPVTGAGHDSLLQNRTRDQNGWMAQVSCEWLSQIDPYFVSLAIGSIGDADQRLVSMLPTLSVGQKREGTMTFRDREASPRFAGPADPKCQFEAVSVDVAAGTVRGLVSCAKVVDKTSGQECAIDEGYFYFENCKPREP